MHKFSALIVAAAMAVGTFGLTGCEEEPASPVDTAGDTMESAGDAASDTMDSASDAASDAADSASDAASDATDAAPTTAPATPPAE